MTLQMMLPFQYNENLTQLLLEEIFFNNNLPILQTKLKFENRWECGQVDKINSLHHEYIAT